MMILIIALLIVAIYSILSILIYLYNDQINVDLIEFEYDNFTNVMTLEFVSKTGRFITESYVGSGTVWHHLPKYKGCSLYEEKLLSRLYTIWENNRNININQIK